jgi:hypothetical protein
MADFAYRGIEQQRIVEVLPELRSAAEYYRRVEGVIGASSKTSRECQW